MNFSKAFWIGAAATFAAGLLLSGCEEEEQDRVLIYEKGTYLGEEDQPLDQETLNELRNRARNQAGA